MKFFRYSRTLVALLVSFPFHYSFGVTREGAIPSHLLPSSSPPYYQEIITKKGVYKSWKDSSVQEKRIFISFTSNKKEPIRYWSHHSYISEFSLHHDEVYFLDGAGSLYKQDNDDWTLIPGKTGKFAKFIKLEDDSNLVVCHPVLITKQLPAGQDRSGGCRSLEQGWNVTITWDQAEAPPVVCRDVIAFVGFVQKSPSLQGWRNRQRVLQTLRLDDGTLTTVKELPRDFHNKDLCVYINQ